MVIAAFRCPSFDVGLWLHCVPQAVFEDSVVKGNMWTGSAMLDQDVLRAILFAAKKGMSFTQPLYKVQAWGSR